MRRLEGPGSSAPARFSDFLFSVAVVFVIFYRSLSLSISFFVLSFAPASAFSVLVEHAACLAWSRCQSSRVFRSWRFLYFDCWRISLSPVPFSALAVFVDVDVLFDLHPSPRIACSLLCFSPRCLLLDLSISFSLSLPLALGLFLRRSSWSVSSTVEKIFLVECFCGFFEEGCRRLRRVLLPWLMIQGVECWRSMKPFRYRKPWVDQSYFPRWGICQGLASASVTTRFPWSINKNKKASRFPQLFPFAGFQPIYHVDCCCFWIAPFQEKKEIDLLRRRRFYTIYIYTILIWWCSTNGR